LTSLGSFETAQHIHAELAKMAAETIFSRNDGTLEAAQRIASHADSRTTKLYNRCGQRVLLEDMERIRYCTDERRLAIDDL
jgi:hypothetical protein